MSSPMTPYLETIAAICDGPGGHHLTATHRRALLSLITELQVSLGRIDLVHRDANWVTLYESLTAAWGAAYDSKLP